MFAWILISSLVASSANHICAPTLPIELEKKEVAASYVGIAFAFYNVGAIVWAPIVGKHLIHRMGAANLLSISVGFLGVTFVVFGFIEVAGSSTSAIILAFLSRFMQGIAGSTHWTTALACITTIAKPEETEKWLGINTAVWGIGFLGGPLLGSILYGIMGFKKQYWVYGSIVIILSVFIRIGLARVPS